MLQQLAGLPTQEGSVQLLNELLAFPAAVVVSATVAASTAVTAAGDLSGVAVGDIVTGLGIVTSPPTTVVALDNAAHTVTLSQAGLGAHVDTPLTFTPVPSPLPSTLHLYKQEFSPSSTSVEADFIAGECTFSGYAPVDLTYGPAGIDANGNGVSFSARAEFQNTTGVDGDSVGGCWLSTAPVAGMPLDDVSIRYYSFPMPIPMSVALQTMGVVVVLNTPNVNGSAIVDN